MDFDFGKLQEAAVDLAQKAAQGVRAVGQKGKNAYTRLTLENALTKAQRQLGAYYYNQVKLGAEHETAITECIAEIDRILDELNALETADDETKEEESAAASTETDTETCPTCGHELPAGAVFCPQCGNKL